MRHSLRHTTLWGLSLALLLACAIAARAEHTRRWRQSTYEDFLKGAAHGVAVRSDGRLELAPRFHLLADADASYLWSLRLDAKGILYAASGSPAKVFRFDAAGKSTAVFESTELSAQALAFDAKGALYVATSPDGKVYRVTPQGDKSVFFQTNTKYIWDLAFGPDGTLYVATGDKGQIYAVAPDGKGDVFYSSDEAHIRVLALDGRGNLIAGTEPSGRVLRISLAAARPGERSAFVLFETPKREITALAVASDGGIYASAIGEKQRPSPFGMAPGAMISTPGGAPAMISGPVIGAGGAQGAAPFIPFPSVLSSSIFRIAPDGAPEELWSSREDVVYSLGLAGDGRVLAGTGNAGSLLAIDGRGVFAQLAKAGSAQITGIARSAEGKVFLCTANPGKVFALGPDYEPEGSYESRSFDAQLFSQWGRIEWWGPPYAPIAGKEPSHSSEPRIEFFVRSGNTEDPGREWSPWAGPYTKSGATAQAPAARFLQWKAVIHDGRPGDGIEWVSVAYLPRNVAPVMDAIVLQDAGVRVQGTNIATGAPGQTPVNLKMPPAPNAPNIISSASQNAPRMDSAPQGFAQKGYRSVLWSAHDDNDDDLRFAVHFRGEAEHDWKLLKDNLDQKFYSWDTTAMPDGAYYLKISVSDAPANPPAAALSAARIGDRFEVDNTPPVIEELQVAAAPAKAVALPVARFTARDAASSIERAQYSIDGGDWILVAPMRGISDAPEELYQFSLVGLVPGEHTLAVRAYDRFDNIGSGKITFNTRPANP